MQHEHFEYAPQQQQHLYYNRAAAVAVDDEILLHQLQHQVEFYFSPENLIRDKYLQQLLAHNFGAVPIDIIAAFPMVRKIYSYFASGQDPWIWQTSPSQLPPADPSVLRRAVALGSQSVWVSNDGLFFVHPAYYNNTNNNNNNNTNNRRDDYNNKPFPTTQQHYQQDQKIDERQQYHPEDEALPKNLCDARQSSQGDEPTVSPTVSPTSFTTSCSEQTPETIHHPIPQIPRDTLLVSGMPHDMTMKKMLGWLGPPRKYTQNAATSAAAANDQQNGPRPINPIHISQDRSDTWRLVFNTVQEAEYAMSVLMHRTIKKRPVYIQFSSSSCRMVHREPFPFTMSPYASAMQTPAAGSPQLLHHIPPPLESFPPHQPPEPGLAQPQHYYFQPYEVQPFPQQQHRHQPPAPRPLDLHHYSNQQQQPLQHPQQHQHQQHLMYTTPIYYTPALVQTGMVAIPVLHFASSHHPPPTAVHRPAPMTPQRPVEFHYHHHHQQQQQDRSKQQQPRFVPYTESQQYQQQSLVVEMNSPSEELLSPPRPPPPSPAEGEEGPTTQPLLDEKSLMDSLPKQQQGEEEEEEEEEEPATTTTTTTSPVSPPDAATGTIIDVCHQMAELHVKEPVASLEVALCQDQEQKTVVNEGVESCCKPDDDDDDGDDDDDAVVSSQVTVDEPKPQHHHNHHKRTWKQRKYGYGNNRRFSNRKPQQQQSQPSQQQHQPTAPGQPTTRVNTGLPTESFPPLCNKALEKQHVTAMPSGKVIDYAKALMTPKPSPAKSPPRAATHEATKKVEAQQQQQEAQQQQVLQEQYSAVQDDPELDNW